MIDPAVVSKIVQEFPAIFQNPESIKTLVFQEAMKILQKEASGQIPGLPTSLSGIKAKGIELAKSELTKRLGSRLPFLDLLKL